MNDSVRTEVLEWHSSGLLPVGRAVLVKPYEPKKLSMTIAIPDSAKERLSMVEQRAVVIAVGGSCWHDEPAPRALPGHHVLIAKYSGFTAGEEVTLDGEIYRLVNDRDIFCRIKPQMEDQNG